MKTKNSMLEALRKRFSIIRLYLKTLYERKILLKEFSLPGAPNFSADLSARVRGGMLVAIGPETVDWSYNTDYTKVWRVLKVCWHGGTRLIGTYKTFNQKVGKKNYTREFQGNIPKYTNEAAVINNKCIYSKKMTEDTVSLVYSNRKFAYASQTENNPSFVCRGWWENQGVIVKTPWQRQDGHTELAFP